ncbi:MAG TPA: lamin tail domain-containing protein [Patescibacteria group bacterium]|nr:lamin tail domain-containing protein [Patescibacteria group bacterium]
MKRGLYCYIVALFFIFQFSIFGISRVSAASANHLVISEVASGVGSSGNEFVEIYNPTGSDILLENFKLALVSSNNTKSNKTITWVSEKKIKAFGYYLFAAGDVGVTADANFSAQLTSTSGVIITDILGNTIDMVSWGAIAPPSNAAEDGGIICDLVTGKSLERKPGISDPTKGNAEDSGNNSTDFSPRDNPEPQNIHSATEVPADYVFPINNSPSVELGGNLTVFKDTEVEFSCPSCADSDGFITSYSWNFGDDSAPLISGNPTVRHTYTTSADYTVSLTVTDDDGATATDSLVVSAVEMPTYSNKVIINEFLPAPGNTTDWDGDGTADSNDEWIELINLDDIQIDLGGWVLDDIESGGSTSYTIPVGTKIDPDGFKVFYKKDTGITLNNTGDDVTLKNPNGVIVDQVTFTNAATDKSFSLSSNSSDGSWVTNYTPSPGRLNTPPANSPPNANAGISITNAKTGETVNFNGSASSDSDGTIASYEWNFGDGLTGYGSQVSHTYSTAGSYQVTLTVRDNNGATSTCSINVSVVQGAISYQNQYSSDIKIISIMPNPDGVEPDSEFIKVTNSGTSDINLRNWVLDDEEGGSKPFIIDYDLVLKAGSSISFYGSDTKISLNNDGDSARLFDPDKKLVSSISYTDKAAKGVPYLFENGKWIWQGLIDQENIEIIKQESEKSINQINPGVVGSNLKPNVTSIVPKESVSQPVTIPKNEATSSIKTTQEVSAYEPIIFSEEKPTVKLVSNLQKQKTAPNSTADFASNSQPQKESAKPYQNPYIVVSFMIVFCGAVLKFIIPSIGLKNSLINFFKNREKTDSIESLFE